MPRLPPGICPAPVEPGGSPVLRSRNGLSRNVPGMLRKPRDDRDVTVFLVARLRVYLDGLSALLAAHGGFDVRGSALDLDSAVAELEAGDGAEIVVVDLAAADRVAGVAALRRACPQARVVALGVDEREDDVVAWAVAGIDGFVPRDASLERLVDALDAVARGEALCPPAMTATLLREVARLAAERRPAAPDRAAHLTRREREIATLLDAGLSNKEIAGRLQIGVPTVKNHVHHVLGKLGVSRRAEATAVLRGQR